MRIVILVLLAAAMAGCLDPYRAHIDAAALEASPVEWTVTEGAAREGGVLGATSVETRYSHSSTTAPFSAVIQVFSVRQLDSRTTAELLAWTENAVDSALAREGIQVDSSKDREGKREWRSGVQSQFFTREGQVHGTAGLFEDSSTVRVLGEVAVDGTSNTQVVVVTLAQVDRVRTCPVIGTCSREVDASTWANIVGDPAGSVGGAVHSDGLIFNMVTHG